MILTKKIMNIYQKKSLILRLAIISTILFVFVQFSAAQQLKPTEIIYSRIPTNPQSPPTGANVPTIWAVGQDGSNDRQITTGDQPRISDDGRFLIFKRQYGGSSFDPFGASNDVYVRELATGQETSFHYASGIGNYYFSPFSNQGSYEIVINYGSHLYKVNRDGTNIFDLTPSASFNGDGFPVLRRSDSLMAFQIQGNNIGATRLGINTEQIDGTNRQKIPNTNLGDYNPAWSNDGQFVAYATCPASRFNCYNVSLPYPYYFTQLTKIKPDGTNKALFVDLGSNDSTVGIAYGGIWTDDNSKIIVAARINNVASLYAVKTDGSGYTQIPISNGNAPDWVGGIVQAREEQQVVASGGDVSSNGNYTLVDTIGETVAGATSVGGAYTFQSGFWATLAAPNKTLFDFDGDGKSDVSVFRPSGGVWYLLQSTNGFTGAQFGISSDKIVPADYDGDGKTDLAVFRDGIWYIQRSTLGFTGISFGQAGDVPVPADYDGDGKADEAVYRGGVWYLLQSSNGFTGTQFGIASDKPVPADFDGDGKTDLAVYRNGTWYLLQSQLGFTGIQFGIASDIPTVGDYDGDGKADEAVYRGGTWYLNRSTLGFTGVQFGIAADIPAAADYDGDGKTDLAVFRNGTWYLLQTTGGFTGVGFGQNGDQPIAAAFVP